MRWIHTLTYISYLRNKLCYKGEFVMPLIQLRIAESIEEALKNAKEFIKKNTIEF